MQAVRLCLGLVDLVLDFRCVLEHFVDFVVEPVVVVFVGGDLLFQQLSLDRQLFQILFHFSHSVPGLRIL